MSSLTDLISLRVVSHAWVYSEGCSSVVSHAQVYSEGCSSVNNKVVSSLGGFSTDVLTIR